MRHKRVRWNKGSFDSAIEAARKLAIAWRAPRYVYATACGWTIVKDRPHLPQDIWAVCSTGLVEHLEAPFLAKMRADHGSA